MFPAKQFTEFINQNNLFTPGNKILAAVSGGMDSVLMAHLLKAAGYNFSIAHCNFQLRGDEARADRDFCQKLAQQLGVQFYARDLDTKAYAAENRISIQMAARDMRYHWFDQLRLQYSYDVIALAHHQNDTIETILLNLTRGTGIAGLHGILPKNGHLVRPLMFLTRDKIQSAIQDNKLDYVEDSSNSTTKYARNKLRHEVIPHLKELNPALERTFEDNLRHFRDLETLLEIKLDELNASVFVEADDELHLSIAAVKALNPQRLLLFKLLQPYGFNETAVNDLISSLDKHPGRNFESEDFKLILDRENIILVKKALKQYTPLQIKEHEHVLTYGDYLITLLHDDSPLIIKDNPLAVSIDAALLNYPLTVRAWKQGDEFYPLGMKTKQKLSDFFIQQKIPLHQKKRIPLLLNANGDIVWVAGYRLNERYKVTDNTKKVTIFELNKT